MKSLRFAFDKVKEYEEKLAWSRKVLERLVERRCHKILN